MAATFQRKARPTNAGQVRILDWPADEVVWPWATTEEKPRRLGPRSTAWNGRGAVLGIACGVLGSPAGWKCVLVPLGAGAAVQAFLHLHW